TQVQGQSSRKQGGTGLGLSISKQLVEKMDGEIGVASVPGAGSTFWFKVRLAKQPAEASAPAGTKRWLSGVRALIVDDNATNREIVGHQLTALGVVHDNTDSGAGALERLRAGAARGAPFDIVVSEEKTPGLDAMACA